MICQSLTLFTAPTQKSHAVKGLNLFALLCLGLGAGLGLPLSLSLSLPGIQSSSHKTETRKVYRAVKPQRISELPQEPGGLVLGKPRGTWFRA